jgi:3-deoxy-D-manno-octulosonic-acid transferase
VGETRAALPLIRALRDRYPGLPLIVTTTTPTGSRQVRDALGGSVYHAYTPYDLPNVVKRFLDRTRPRLLVVMETELWPNIFRLCNNSRIPIIVANARLSERSARNYGRLPGLVMELLRDTTLIAAQTEADAARFRALGAPRVSVTGNIKYDLTLPEGLPEQGRILRRQLGEPRPVLVAASTHAGEDEIVLDACERVRRALPEMLLILVPRHPERFDGVAELCRRRGLGIVRRSEGRPCIGTTQVYLGDSMGELLLFFAASDLALIGGSLVPVGGHNVLEPASLGLPVVFGPHMFNFVEASQRLLQAGAAWQVVDAEELAETVSRLLADPVAAREAGRRGRAVVEANRGALSALLEMIAETRTAPPG